MTTVVQQHNQSCDFDAEHCPICGEKNYPFFMLKCEHFMGIYGDDEILFSEDFYLFHEQWKKLGEHRKSLAAQHDKDTSKTLRTIVDGLALDPIYIEFSDTESYSPVLVLNELIDFHYQPKANPPEIFSSVPLSLYHSSPLAVIEVAINYQAINTQLEKLFSGELQ